MKQFYEGKNVDIRGNIRPIDKENKKFVFSHENYERASYD